MQTYRRDPELCDAIRAWERWDGKMLLEPVRDFALWQASEEARSEQVAQRVSSDPASVASRLRRAQDRCGLQDPRRVVAFLRAMRLKAM